MDVCTIIAKNYVANARVLARSLAATNPGARLWTLIIDDFSRHIDPVREPFEVLTPDEVGCDPFVHMALRYSVLELSTAVKPWLLRHLMGVTGGPVTYLDPDIKVYGSLAELDALARQHGVVLTPHTGRPIPQDGRKPSQVDIMISGVYNLGYISASPRPEVDRLLDWWAERLRRDCRVDPIWGYFVDQRWFDLAPGFLEDVAIMREPQYNVAYWNLHERPLVKAEGVYRVDGRPLAFFHFSGFDPQQPLILSRHQDRIDVGDDPVLRELLATYAAEVLAEGYAEARHWPYDYGSLADGTRLDDRLREAFDEYASAHGDQVASPFTLDGVRAFDTWLMAPASGAPPGVSRAAARVYEARIDIRGAFPDVAGADREDFLEWAAGPGAAEESLLARAPVGAVGAPRRAGGPDAAGGGAPNARSGAAPPPAAPLRGAPWGLNVVGDFHSDGAGGDIARAVLAALDGGDLRALPVLSRTMTPDAHALSFAAVGPEEAPFAANLVCVGPEVLPELVNAFGSEFFAGRFSVGLWFWPVAGFPEDWRDRFSLLEEIWAPSAFAAAALERYADAPVQVMPFPVQPPLLEPRTRVELGMPRGRLFLTRVDYRSDPARQNPLAVVAAFRQAFGPEDDVALLVDCAYATLAPDAHAELRLAAEGDARIQVLDQLRSSAEKLSAIALCDCFVSLHRSVAFGIDLGHAMWLGRSVIATGYSGNREFMTAENSFLVDHTLVPIGPGHGNYPPEEHWAEPEGEQAAGFMRRVFEDEEFARERGALGAESVRSTHSPQATARFVGRRMGSVRVVGRARRPSDPLSSHPQTLTRLPKRILDGPPPPAGGRGVPGRTQMREMILRLMKPYTAHQQAVDAEIVAALAELSRAIVQLRDSAGADGAQRLAAERRGDALAVLRSQLQGVEDIKRILTQDTDRNVYVAVSELCRRHAEVAATPGMGREDPALSGYELRAFSQNGEDGVLAEILRRTGAPTRHFVEFGVESGREGNCVYLADVAGWQGLFMEAGDDMYRRLESKYAAQNKVSTIRARVNVDNVESLFVQAGVPTEPDVVSIDIDGQDYWIWSAIEAYRPRVLVIEYNSSLDPRRCLVQPDEPGHGWEGTAYYGASLGALERLGERKDYRLVHTDLSGVNAFFVRGDLAGDSFPADEDVARRGTPNYYQRGLQHPAPTPGARYLDLETGRMVRG